MGDNGKKTVCSQTLIRVMSRRTIDMHIACLPEAVFLIAKCMNDMNEVHID